ncbi:hypothetical protein BC830DRAFT_399893 [Chytriomyces sp. MP71]|nr:hypothetical protein BC830DRAFT_399893 [Chytriomyces sp. MP71]
MQLRNNASRVNHTTRSNTCPNCCMPIYAPQATKSLEDDVQTPQKECEGFESTYFSRQRPLPTKCPVCKNPIAYPQLNENQSAVLLGRLSGISKPSMNSKVLNLQALNLNENLLTDESLECISTRILPVSRGLLKLDLKGNQFTADGVKVLAHHLPPTNITHLNLSGIKLTDSGLQPLARCLNLTSLRSLILADNLITQSGIGSLAPYLPDTRIAVLDLGCNQGIRDQGLAGLSAVLSRTCISELILAECDFGFQGLQALTKVLRKSRISHLKISRNRRIGDNGIKYLSEYGLKNCEQLTQLHIRAVNALDAGCCALASVLASPRCSLRVLDMRDNGITNKGAFALNGVGFGLLETVKLGENDITDRGVEALASAFVRSRVVELSLEDNKFSDVGVDALVMAFEQARRGRMVKITW